MKELEGLCGLLICRPDKMSYFEDEMNKSSERNEQNCEASMSPESADILFLKFTEIRNGIFYVGCSTV